MSNVLAVDLAIRFDVVSIGILAGLGYAVLAAGLVLVYRFSRVINLAHGQIGAFAAVVLVECVNKFHMPYLIGLPLAIATGGLVGVVMERLLVRPLAKRSVLAVLVATIGATQLLLVMQALAPKIIGNLGFPVLAQFTYEVRNLVLHGEHATMVVIGVVGLGLFTNFMARTQYGLAVRAVADNNDAARLAGIDADKVARVVWAVSGMLAAAAAIATLPLTGAGAGIGPQPALGPSLLLRALAAGLVGGMTSLPRTVAAGVGIGVLEAVLFASYPSDLGIVDAVLFVAVLAMLLLRSRNDRERSTSLVFGTDPTPLPAAVRNHPRVKALRRVGTAGVLAFAFGLPFIASSSSDLFLLSRVPVFALVGVSVVVLTGWAGQLSLGQMAFVGIGAMGTAAIGSRGVPLGAAIAYMVFLGALIAIAVGAPALRLRGLFLTVTTLALAVATSTYVLPLELFRSASVNTAVVTPGKFGPIDFGSYKTGYYACLVTLLVVVVMARRIRSSGVGRLILAVEGNEASASAMTISPAMVKLQSFALSGALAVLAGGLLAMITRTFQTELFSPEQSLQVLAMTVVGGIGSVGGAVLGALYFIGLPHLFGDNGTMKLTLSGVGLLVILRAEPGGLMAVGERIRDHIVRRLVPDADFDEGEVSDRSLSDVRERLRATTTEVAAIGAALVLPLELAGINVTLGGRRIITDVSLHVASDEIVGLIGSNGAGKTTLMNAVSGFVPASGRVVLHGQELNDMAPHVRARQGLGRSFQTASLFPRLTTRECILVALESQWRSELVPTALALPPAVRVDRRQAAAADDLIDLVGLGSFANTPARTLSTGTRRIVELACLLAVQPSMVLLDEPLAGIAQRESEAFGELIVDVRRRLGIAMLVIEHDLPMICEISDRLYCLETGSVIATGPPDGVRRDPRVIASYLGTDERAINRSRNSAKPKRVAAAARTRSPRLVQGDTA